MASAGRAAAAWAAILALPAALTSVASARRDPPRSAPERAHDARAELARCLGGEGAGKPSLRVRAAALAAMGAPRDPTWPARCARHARALHDALADTGARGPLPRAASRLAWVLETGAAPEELSRATADVLDDGAGAGTPGDAPPDFDHLEAPIAPPGTPLDALREDRVVAPTRHLLAPDRICTLAPDARELSCAPLPGAGSMRLLGAAADGAPPLLFAAPAGELGVFRAGDAAPLDARASYGGLSRADGFVALAGWDADADGVRVARVLADGRRSVIGTGVRVAFDDQIALLWDRLVWIDGGVLRERRVRDDDAPLDPERELGRVPDFDQSADALRACKSDAALFLVVRARGGDRALRLDDPAPQLWTLSGSGGALSCDGESLRVTRLVADACGEGCVSGVVERETCGASGCTAARARLEDVFRADLPEARPREPRDVAAVPAGPDVALVWWAKDGGGVRMRRAPAGDLASAHERVLFDDRVRAGAVGAESTLREVRALRGPLLLLSTDGGVYARLLTSG